MPDFRRWYVPGGTYFFTLVTHERQRLFLSEIARRLLREALQTQKDQRPFEIVAMCLLPDHLHAVLTLPPGDADYSVRWRRIKEDFTENWLASGGSEGSLSASRRKRKERGVWQRRFWEHTVNGDADLHRCVDYTHWNPRKHGLVRRVRDWPWSTFLRFVEQGEYSIDWGGTDPTPGWAAPEWGE